MKRLTMNALVLILAGTLLLVQSVYLVSVKVTHLGVLLPACLGAVALTLGLMNTRWQRWLTARPRIQHFWRLACIGFFAWLLSVLFFFGFMQRQTREDVVGNAPDVVVVLGSSTPDEKPSPALVERLRVSYALAQQYPKTKVVVSGGVDFRQVTSEAQVMSSYLQSLGLDKARILLEDRSTSTHENLIFSARVLQANGLGLDSSTVVVTNDFHTLRARWIAQKVGYQNVQAMGAPTPLYMRYNAWLREYFACLSGWMLGEF